MQCAFHIIFEEKGYCLLFSQSSHQQIYSNFKLHMERIILKHMNSVLLQLCVCVCVCMRVCICVCVYTYYLVGQHRRKCLWTLFVIWLRSEEMHSVRVNIDCVTQCATQQPDSSCLCRRDILEKVLEQFLHWYFFTSEWVCR